MKTIIKIFSCFFILLSSALNFNGLVFAAQDIPVLVLQEKNLLSDGKKFIESAQFVLYDSGVVIYRPLKDYEEEYLFAELDCTTKNNILNSLPLAQFEKLKPFYITSKVFDLTKYVIYSSDQSFQKQVSVYGLLAPLAATHIQEKTQTSEISKITRQSYRKTPKPFLKIYEYLHNFSVKNSKQWIPSQIEIYLKRGPASKNSIINWPVGWPDLEDPKTEKKNKNEYVVHLPAKHYNDLKILVKKLKDGHAVLLNDQYWSFKYKFSLPEESKWSKRLTLSAGE